MTESEQAAYRAGQEDMRERAMTYLKDEGGACDCFARSESECACGAWYDSKTVSVDVIITAIAALPIKDAP